MEDYLGKDIDAATGPSLDNRAAMRVDLSSAPVELVDVENKDVTPEEEGDVASKPSTTSFGHRAKPGHVQGLDPRTFRTVQTS